MQLLTLYYWASSLELKFTLMLVFVFVFFPEYYYLLSTAEYYCLKNKHCKQETNFFLHKVNENIPGDASSIQTASFKEKFKHCFNRLDEISCYLQYDRYLSTLPDFRNTHSIN